MKNRSLAVTAAIVGAAALTATGINYAVASDQAPQAPKRPAPAAAPAAEAATAPLGGSGKQDYDHEGRIHINERSYSAASDGCTIAVSGLGARSFNIRNDTNKTVEVFRGATCDNGAPIATVGPHSTSNGVKPHWVDGGLYVEDGVVGSFRVVESNHRKW
ncbi:hypothetical protein [Streptomyces sp. NPDC058542]|uniref:hypothetical protein n=1 Tax=Streptomyces sp. NPDC058542 TaxID=3346543 RepID=UPI0036480974